VGCNDNAVAARVARDLLFFLIRQVISHLACVRYSTAGEQRPSTLVFDSRGLSLPRAALYVSAVVLCSELLNLVACLQGIRYSI
jgi:hypothetical protein